MIKLHYIIGREAVQIYDSSFEGLMEYGVDNTIDLRVKEFESEKEKQAFIAGLYEIGDDNYSIVAEEEAKQILEL